MLVGQEVLFVFAGQPDDAAPIVSYAWELDGDGDFNDASGIALRRTFSAPGDYVIGLKVTDKRGAFGSEFREVHVRSSTIVDPASPRLLSPFPVVRITGRVTPGGARIRLLTVLAPLGAEVTVGCRGRGCPFTKSSRVARRLKKDSPKSATATVRFRKMERRLLRGGATIRVYVTRPGWIGKYTRWTIRKAKHPLRRDLCLAPGVTAPAACPT